MWFPYEKPSQAVSRRLRRLNRICTRVFFFPLLTFVPARVRDPSWRRPGGRLNTLQLEWRTDGWTDTAGGLWAEKKNPSSPTARLWKHILRDDAVSGLFGAEIWPLSNAFNHKKERLIITSAWLSLLLSSLGFVSTKSAQVIFSPTRILLLLLPNSPPLWISELLRLRWPTAETADWKRPNVAARWNCSSLPKEQTRMKK